MGIETERNVEYLVVDTTAFIQNAPLQNVAKKIITCQDVVDEILNKRQLRRLVVLPYDLEIKEVFSENIKVITDFAIKTGDYRSLSATDIKVIALTYQLEKEHVGIGHLRTEPIIQRSVNVTKDPAPAINSEITGFYMPREKLKETESKDETEQEKTQEDLDEKLAKTFETLHCENEEGAEVRDENVSKQDDIQVPISDQINENQSDDDEEVEEEEDDNDEDSWITPSNVKLAQQQVQSKLTEEKQVKVACMTTDFAMQNVLKQMNLNVAALDGRVIKQLYTFILRCYACFKTTSIMTKQFCPKCGLNTLKKVAVSLDEDGKLQIHINAKKPLTGKGKKFSLPRMKGGKHPNNPVLAEDAPLPQNRASKLARTKVNPLDDDYIVGFSPFAVRDVTSRSAQLCIRPGQEMKHWMRKNPNEARRRRK